MGLTVDGILVPHRQMSLKALSSAFNAGGKPLLSALERYHGNGSHWHPEVVSGFILFDIYTLTTLQIFAFTYPCSLFCCLSEQLCIILLFHL